VSLQAQELDELSDRFDRSVGFDRSRGSRIAPPHREHSGRARTADIGLGVVTNEDRLPGIGPETRQRTREDFRIRLVDSLNL
jgi:hypothetical protein